jgi:hypothetical protein
MMNVAQVGDSSAIAAVDTDSLWFYWQTIGTAPWHPEQVTGPIVLGVLCRLPRSGTRR